MEQVRESSTETFWQSDGNGQPHWIQLSWSRRTPVSHVCLFLNYSLDESYTPKKLQIEAGMTPHDFGPAWTVEVSEPVGWVIVPITNPPDPLDPYATVVRAHVVRVTVLLMHQNGRDTHVRQLKMYGPGKETKESETPRVVMGVIR